MTFEEALKKFCPDEVDTLLALPAGHIALKRAYGHLVMRGVNCDPPHEVQEEEVIG